MSHDTGLDLVTGAFSHIGSHIARRLLGDGRRVRTLTYHPDRAHELRDRVEVATYSFDDGDALVGSLAGVTTLYNTYWVRIEHGGVTFETAVENSRTLFEAAKRAGVPRIVHVSVSNPSLDSPLPYYGGKARVEQALAGSGLPHSIIRPTLVFGSDREVLVNNIAYLLRRLPLFGVPGDGRYRVQPVHVEYVARICVEQAKATGNATVDAAGPETIGFAELVKKVRRAIEVRTPILRVPVPAMTAASKLLGHILRDVVLTREEIDGLMQELLVSNEPAQGEIAFSSWLRANSSTLGREYANELRRHFAGA
jgi:NADH dehydrogenase